MSSGRMTSSSPPFPITFGRHTSWCLLVFQLFAFLVHTPSDVNAEEGGASGCPNVCSCLGKFVSCFGFDEDTLTKLTLDMNELVLHGGSIQTLPAGFFTGFPSLTFLEIQSTKVDTISSGTFADMSGLDQLSLTDCNVGVIESGAFRNLTAISQFFVSGSSVVTIKSGAFSDIHCIDDFRVWNNHIGMIERVAFGNLSEIGSFALYLNNVTSMDAGAFTDVDRFGNVDINLNVFESFYSEAIVPLNAATEDMNMYSNTFVCECSVLRLFSRPEMARFLASQKCLLPERNGTLKLSDEAVEQLCIDLDQRQQTTSGEVTTFNLTHVDTTKRSPQPKLTTPKRPPVSTNDLHDNSHPSSASHALGQETIATATTFRPTVTSRSATPMIEITRGSLPSASTRRPGRVESSERQQEGSSSSNSNAGAKIGKSWWPIVLSSLFVCSFCGAPTNLRKLQS